MEGTSLGKSSAKISARDLVYSVMRAQENVCDDRGPGPTYGVAKGGNIENRRPGPTYGAAKGDRRGVYDTSEEKIAYLVSKKKHPGLLVAGESITAAAENVEDITSQDLSLHSLEVLAAKYMEQGLVPFFGCSKCRFSRGGCIDYRCNFDKFKAHMAKYPEKYDGKNLKGVLKDLTVKELVG
jgi:hypothetical protein